MFVYVRQGCVFSLFYCKVCYFIFQMSEELVKQLSNYKAQLQQVEAALSTDPDNEDLRKLQKDLQVWGTIILCFFFFSMCLH